MGRYIKGDHVSIEVVNDDSAESEWVWLLVDHSDDSRQIVYGRLDSEPIVNVDLRLAQELAVRYDRIRKHRQFT